MRALRFQAFGDLVGQDGKAFADCFAVGEAKGLGTGQLEEIIGGELREAE